MRNTQREKGAIHEIKTIAVQFSCASISRTSFHSELGP